VVNEAVGLAPDAYFVKPVDPEQLTAWVEACVGRVNA
jgi:DNA-binding response OmpR family regulator